MIDWIRKMWKKYAEIINYLIFGVLATLLNIVLYAVFQAAFGYEAANSWGNVLDNIICILFAYWTNRTWVFVSKTHGKEAWTEFGKFVTCRLGTMVIDTIIVLVGGNVIGPALIAAQYLKLWGTGVKVFSNVVVIVLNYVFSKLIIFKKKS
jgi:putative flippase GtrA